MTFNVFEMGIEESVQRAFDVLRDGGIVIEAIYGLPWSKCCSIVINKYSVAQPDSHDIYKIPTAKFLRIRMSDETARVLGHEPWQGGIPPYQWIGEQIAPILMAMTHLQSLNIMVFSNQKMVLTSIVTCMFQ